MRVLISFSSRVVMNICWIELSTDIFRSCCHAKLGIVGMFFWWSPVSHLQIRGEHVAFLVRKVGCVPETTSYTVRCVLLLLSTLSFRFALPRNWPVCCIGPYLTLFWGLVHFATCLTVLIDSFRLSFCSFTVLIVLVVIIVVLGNKVTGATAFVARISSCVFNLLFFSLVDAGFDMSWFFLQWWHVVLGLSAFAFAAFYLTVLICCSSGASKPFSSNS